MSMMRRVNRANKCPICDGETWCLIGTSVVICMRTVSPRSKTFKGGEVGYIHPYGDKKATPPPREPRKPPQINAKRVLQDWARAYSNERMPLLSNRLGVSLQSLKSLECQAGGNIRSWGFPMKDGHGNYIGIRIRNEEGRKWAATGSQAGIFIPNVIVRPRLLILEGPTNTAAAITLGFFAIGRPSCSGGVSHIQDFVRQQKIVKEVVIIADNDPDKPDPKNPGKFKINPGATGAKSLQEWLPVPSCILMLPVKDMRDFLRVGTKQDIEGMIDQLMWTQPRATSSSSPHQPAR